MCRGARPRGGLALANLGPLLHIAADGRGCSSGVEHHVANVRVVGSNPIARSSLSIVSPTRTQASLSPLQPAVRSAQRHRWRAGVGPRAVRRQPCAKAWLATTVDLLFGILIV